ncbi:hypothetical protein [Spiroplasma citri]|uniref:hypothetical protein n=1 Tax=Spiroplasma citri TaxID=2133 RepID=UPI00286EE68A|nr:hypothetical protein [Spiroplasma citri]
MSGNLFNIVYFERSEHAERDAIFKNLERRCNIPTWLTTIFSVVIVLAIFLYFGLLIYQKIRQIRGKKKEKKKLKERRVINNVRYVFNNSV